jgi:hypothetical protein
MSKVKLDSELTLETETITGTTKVKEDNGLLREQTDAYSGGGSTQLILCGAMIKLCSFTMREHVAAIVVASE